MEGVPRISMMSFPLRRSADTPNLKTKLKQFITDQYSEDGESYGNEINELESLRAAAIHVSKDFAGCSTLKKYFCQLNFLKSRFPLQEGGPCAVSFSWHDVYSETVHGWSDIDFEMSCILYNIGALHSELGCTDGRQTADGMKNACTHFQCAAWAFQNLRHNYQKFFTPDVSPDMLSIMTNVCLAQAQECILEKSLIDNRKSTITAKVALQIVEYYQLSLKTIDQMLKDSSQYSDKAIKAVKKSRKLVELKVHYYGCLSLLYRGIQSEDEGKWGDRVCFYKASIEKLTEAIKSAKAMEKTDTVHDSLQFTFDVVQGKVAISEKENEFVYHEKVPETSAISTDIKGVPLVKGIPFKFDDPQISGPDIFGRLVPIEAHEASSMYSEEKAKVLRNYSAKIEEKNEDLDRVLIALQLDQIDLHSTTLKVPQELVDCCAALSVNKDAVKKLSDLMSNLSGMYHDVDGNLQEIHQLLLEDETKSKEYQKIVGKRPPSNVITDLSREVHKYQDAHSVAAGTNQTLHETLLKHVKNLQILMKPLSEVVKHIPSMEENDQMDEEAIALMKRLTAKVEEMKKQRISLEEQLRDSVHRDDITKQLVVKKDQDLETVFQEELKKHDKITQILDQNLLAQDNIIRALTEANANYSKTRKRTMEIVRKRSKVIEELLNSYEMYDELLSKCSKGVEFYTKLDGNVLKLLQRVRGVCKVQEEEREQKLNSLMRKGQHASVPNANTTATSYTSYPTQDTQIPLSLPSSSGGPPKLKDYLALRKSTKASTTDPHTLNNFDPSMQHPMSTGGQQYINAQNNPAVAQDFPQYDSTGASYYSQQNEMLDYSNNGPGVHGSQHRIDHGNSQALSDHQQPATAWSTYNASNGITNTSYSYPAYSSGMHSAGVAGSMGVSMTSQSIAGNQGGYHPTPEPNATGYPHQNQQYQSPSSAPTQAYSPQVQQYPQQPQSAQQQSQYSQQQPQCQYPQQQSLYSQQQPQYLQQQPQYPPQQSPYPQQQPQYLQQQPQYSQQLPHDPQQQSQYPQQQPQYPQQQSLYPQQQPQYPQQQPQYPQQHSQYAQYPGSVQPVVASGPPPNNYTTGQFPVVSENQNTPTAYQPSETPSGLTYPTETVPSASVSHNPGMTQVSNEYGQESFLAKYVKQFQ